MKAQDEYPHIKNFIFKPTGVTYEYIDSFVCEGRPVTMVYIKGNWKLYESDVIDYWLNRNLIKLIEKENV